MRRGFSSVVPELLKLADFCLAHPDLSGYFELNINCPCSSRNDVFANIVGNLPCMIDTSPPYVRLKWEVCKFSTYIVYGEPQYFGTCVDEESAVQQPDYLGKFGDSHFTLDPFIRSSLTGGYKYE